MTKSFRPDLEGLRGVAVALVVLFHARLLGVSGGFVGVDAFYVLSGYLISGLLLREMSSTGGIDLVAFYVRRARRILPAATVAIVAALAVATMLVAPLDLPSVAIDAAASGLFVGNVAFAIRATDYFATGALSPFLHYWSLGVEEQYYLVWPLFLLMAARLRRLSRLVTAAFVVSLALSIVLTALVPPWAFYGLPTRAWELALGALVALHEPRLRALRPWVLAAGGWIGLALLVVASFTLDPASSYPGYAALLPTVAVALVIAAGPQRLGPGGLLGLAPVRGLGRISFSLYLYHWPAFVLAANAAGELSMEMRWVAVGLSVVLATLSRRFVEGPFLRGRMSPRAPRRALALAGSAVATVLVVAQIVSATATAYVAAADEAPGTGGPAVAGISEWPVADATVAFPSDAPLHPIRLDPTPSPTPSGPRDLQPRLVDARKDTDGLNDRGCGLSLSGTTPPRCDLGAADGAITVALVGDSHAAQWSPALELIASQRGWRLVPFTKDSCIFLDMRIVSLHLEREYTECAQWRAKVVAALEKLHPDLVVVSSSRWVHPVDARDADVSRQVDAMVRLLTQVHGRIALIADTPLSEVDVPACLTRKDRTPESCATARSYALTAHLARDGRVAERLAVTLIDPARWLCDAEVCPAVIDRTIVFRDDHHLTATMARRLAALLESGVLAALETSVR